MKTKLMFFALLLASIFANAQVDTLKSFGQKTTQEEYNYITKGYKVQIESGLDMKKGYRLVDLGDWGLNKGAEVRRCTFKALIRTGQTKPCAIMMVYKRADISNGLELYVCIPSPNSEPQIWQQTFDFISNNFKDSNVMMQATIWALMNLSAQEISR